MVLQKYYYSQLTPMERKVYEGVYKGLLLHQENIRTAGLLTPEKSIGKIMKSVLYDHPEIYYLDREYSYISERKQMEIHVKYLFNRERCRQYDQDINRKIKKVTLPILNGRPAAYLIEKALYEYFASHYTYDDRKLSEHDRIGFCFKHSILGPIQKKTAVCAGFAKAFKLILDRMGLECMVVHGFSDFARAGIQANDGGHAWNIVYLHGAYYHVDVTWAICCSNRKEVCYDYLNLSDVQIRRDHKGFGGTPICKGRMLAGDM